MGRAAEYATTNQAAGYKVISHKYQRVILVDILHGWREQSKSIQHIESMCSAPQWQLPG